MLIIKNIAMKKVIFATGVAVLALATVVGAQGYTFSANLTVGSTGPDVVALQTALMSAGFNIPAIASGAAAKGYFGSQTQAAVKLYQAAHGVPNTGFVGPLTRAALNGSASASSATGSTVAVTCPAGYVCTPAAGSTTTTTTTVTGGATGGITTPGVSGVMTVTSGPLSSSVLNVGQQKVAIETVRVQAQYSDIDVQSITMNLGSNTSIYNKLFNTLYVTDGTNVLASQPLNGSTVVQSGSEYIIALTGFHFIVPKGTYKDIVIKGDLNTSIDTSYTSSSGSHYPGGSGGAPAITVNGTPISSGWGIGVQANGVRGVDGAGLNLYGPATAFNQALTINASLVDNAQANISLDAASPLVSSVPVTDTTNNQYLGLPVFVFDVNAQNDTLHLHEVKVRFATGGTAGSIGAAYLFNGSTQIMSASVVNGVADFTNITDGMNGTTIPVNTTVPFTVKVDVTGVTSGNTFTVTASSTSSDITTYNSIDSTAIQSGSAVGNQITVSGKGPLFVLSGTPTITKSVLSTDQSGNATTSYSATFNVQVTAVGGSINLGLSGSSTPMFATTGAGTAGVATTSIGIYQNGVLQSITGFSTNSAVTASYSQPTNTTMSSDGTYFTLAQNQTVTIPVTFTWLVKNPGSNTYAGQLQGINYELPGSALSQATFMANQTAWRTSSI